MATLSWRRQLAGALAAACLAVPMAACESRRPLPARRAAGVPEASSGTSTHGLLPPETLSSGLAPPPTPTPRLSTAPATPRYSLGNASRGQFVHSVATSQRLIALTFDDGPSRKNLPRIIAALRSVGGHATFFEVGGRSIGHDDLLEMIVRSGNELGDHTYTHAEVGRGASTADIASAIARTATRFRQATGVRPVLFRPPSGHYDARLSGLAGEQGMAVILWNIHSGDTNGDSSARITRTVLGSARPGAIVLMHETAPNTVAAMPAIVAGLNRRGYRMVTVSELLGSGQPR